MKSRLNNKSGVVMIMSLFVMLLLVTFSAIFMMRTVNENNATIKDREQTQAFYIAEGGGYVALQELDYLINTLMFNEINSTNPSTVISKTEGYYTSSDAIGFLIDAVKDSSRAPCSPSPSCLEVFTLNGSEAEYSFGPITLGNGSYQVDISVTKKKNPSKPTTDVWQFYYDYAIEATGIEADQSRTLKLNGDFTVTVQRDNFAKYALFTNTQTTPSGSSVWFTSNTNFSGPVHTNNRFNFYGNPSGTFEGEAAQTEQRARYYNNGWTVLLDDDHNGTRDVPTFNAGFTRGADAISLSSPVQQQDLIDQVLGSQTYSSDGIYVPNNGSSLTGGIYIRGSGDVEMQVDGDNAKYKLVQGGTTKYVTVDRVNNQTTVETVSGPTVVYNGVPDGVDGVGTIIYVSGSINNFSGTVQKDTKLTVSSSDDIVINDNVVYSNYTPATGSPGDADYVPPSAEGTDNLLGIVSWNGDVRIGNSAPDDVNIHGTILSANGIFTVDNYNNTWVGPRGTATLLGGVITDNYGAFGLFNGTTGASLSGYGRNFVYDGRMLTGSAPPYFPTLNTFVAYTPDISDKIVWQEGGS